VRNAELSQSLLTSAATRAVQATSFNDSVFQTVLLAAILVCFGVAAADKADFTGCHFTPGRRTPLKAWLDQTPALLESTTRGDASVFSLLSRRTKLKT